MDWERFFTLLHLNHPCICYFHVSSSFNYTKQINIPLYLMIIIICFFKAPSQPPANIAWKLTDSKICLNWEHVKTMENESEVLGYKVSNFFISLTRHVVYNRGTNCDFLKGDCTLCGKQ